ncbi:hypothetical protein H2201_008267 [Coniosporium apollinis]|uniref:GTP-binding protein 8 n=1 Tax=Coniosporium apollinis TaxID=61459 RepID=A0ABQ9NJY7_9PEZI|nr:hypothetical protein H2201_008267 [Coniosporium apollinis]
MRQMHSTAPSLTPSPSSATSTPPTPLTLSTTTLNLYHTTLPPTPPQLTYASRFFARSPPQFLFSAANFRSFPDSLTPEVAFLGRSNVGKSSLLNALLNRSTNKIAHVSSKPGRTRVMNAFGVGVEGGMKWEKKGGHEGGKDGGRVGEGERWIGKGGVVIVDMPGYGKGSREEWGTEILKYLCGRRQLRRAFLLIDAEHGIKTADEQLLTLLRENGVPHQVILSKVDKLISPGSKLPSPDKLATNLQKLRTLCEETRKVIQPPGYRGPVALGEVLTCSAEKSIEAGKKLGIDGIRWAVLQAAGLECDAHGRRRISQVHVLEDTNGEVNR